MDKRDTPARDPGPPRGLLRPSPGPGTFHHARIAPSRALGNLVQHFWIVRWDLRGHAPQTREVLTHPNVHLVIEPGRSRVLGVQAERFTTVLEGEGGVFGVKFRPGAFRPLLGRSVSSLRNRRVAPVGIFGEDAAALDADVSRAAPDDDGMVVAAERWLRARAPAADPNVARASAIVDWIAADREVTRVEQVAARRRLHVRALQRLFNEYVGVGPKWVIGRYRLHEALERLEQGGVIDWPGLAADLGYFDQAHFIRDFKALTGRTPGGYARAER